MRVSSEATKSQDHSSTVPSSSVEPASEKVSTSPTSASIGGEPGPEEAAIGARFRTSTTTEPTAVPSSGGVSLSVTSTRTVYCPSSAQPPVMVIDVPV